MNDVTPKKNYHRTELKFDYSEIVFLSLFNFYGQKQPPEEFDKEVVLKNFANFTGKQL